MAFLRHRMIPLEKYVWSLERAKRLTEADARAKVLIHLLENGLYRVYSLPDTFLSYYEMVV